MERNISSLGKTLNRFIQAQRTSREQVRNEARYSTRRSPIRETYKGSHWSRSPHRRHHFHHFHRQRSESPISLAASQSDIYDDSESDYVYHNPPAVTETVFLTNSQLFGMSSLSAILLATKDFQDSSSHYCFATSAVSLSSSISDWDAARDMGDSERWRWKWWKWCRLWGDLDQWEPLYVSLIGDRLVEYLASFLTCSLEVLWAWINLFKVFPRLEIFLSIVCNLFSVLLFFSLGVH